MTRLWTTDRRKTSTITGQSAQAPFLHHLSPFSYLKQKCCVWTYILRQMRVSSWSGSLTSLLLHYNCQAPSVCFGLSLRAGVRYSCVYQTVWKTPELLALRVLTHAEVTRVPVPRVACHWPQVPDLTELEWHNYPLPNARITDLLDIILNLKLHVSLQVKKWMSVEEDVHCTRNYSVVPLLVPHVPLVHI